MMVVAGGGNGGGGGNYSGICAYFGGELVFAGMF